MNLFSRKPFARVQSASPPLFQSAKLSAVTLGQAIPARPVLGRYRITLHHGRFWPCLVNGDSAWHVGEVADQGRQEPVGQKAVRLCQVGQLTAIPERERHGPCLVAG